MENHTVTFKFITTQFNKDELVKEVVNIQERQQKTDKRNNFPLHNFNIEVVDLGIKACKEINADGTIINISYVPLTHITLNYDINTKFDKSIELYKRRIKRIKHLIEGMNEIKADFIDDSYNYTSDSNFEYIAYFNKGYNYPTYIVFEAFKISYMKNLDLHDLDRLCKTLVKQDLQQPINRNMFKGLNGSNQFQNKLIDIYSSNKYIDIEKNYNIIKYTYNVYCQVGGLNKR